MLELLRDTDLLAVGDTADPEVVVCDVPDMLDSAAEGSPLVPTDGVASNPLLMGKFNGATAGRVDDWDMLLPSAVCSGSLCEDWALSFARAWVSGRSGDELYDEAV